MRLAPRTILGQLVAGSLIVQAIVFLAFTVVNVRGEQRAQLAHEKARIQQQTDLVAKLLADPLARGDIAAIDTVLDAFQTNVYIKGLRLTDTQGHVLRSSGVNAGNIAWKEQALLPEVLADHAFHLVSHETHVAGGAQAVVSGNTVSGIVWLTPVAASSQLPATLTVVNIVTFTACALLCNLLLIIWLARSVTRPLRQLRVATQRMREDHSDLSAFPLPADTQNEAGALQASFNAMVEELTLRRKGIQETVQLLDAMLESAPVGIAFVDRELRYVRVNQNLARMHDMSVEAHVGKRYRDLFPPGTGNALVTTVEAGFKRCFESGAATHEYELKGVAPNGTGVRTWRVNLFPVRSGDEEARYIGVMGTDITESRQEEEAMRQSERLAAAGRLAASIAHELNNPLESVTNLLYLLQMDRELPERSREYVALAQSEASRMCEITQQTLKFYRQSTGACDVRLPDLLRSVLVLYQARFLSPRIQVQCNLADGAVLFGYPSELRLLFADLIGNAADAMPQGGTLYVRARQTRRDGKPGVRVTVADTGIGIAKTALSRATQPMFRAEQLSGASLCQQVSGETVVKHGACVHIRSRVTATGIGSSGTVFSIFFPCDGVPRGPIRVHSAAQVLADHER